MHIRCVFLSNNCIYIHIYLQYSFTKKEKKSIDHPFYIMNRDLGKVIKCMHIIYYNSIGTILIQTQHCLLSIFWCSQQISCPSLKIWKKCKKCFLKEMLISFTKSSHAYKAVTKFGFSENLTILPNLDSTLSNLEKI